jgi:hypothetical protein
MKKYILSILLLATLQINAQGKNDKKSTDRNDPEPYSVKRFDNAKVSHVFSETTGGNITVTGENTTSPRVEIYAQRNNSRSTATKEEIKERIESDYEINVSISGGKITATSRYLKKTWDNNKSLNISFKIFVPQNVITDLHTSGGNISLSNLTGKQDFRTSGGNLSLTNLSGNVKGRTSGGNISVKDSKDDLDLETSGGSIYAERSAGNIRIITSGGNINMSDLKGTVRATTSGGSVYGENISADLNTETSGGNISLKDLSGSVTAYTSAGNLEVSVRTMGKDIKLGNSAGSIYLQLPKNAGMNLLLTGDEISAPTLTGFSGKQDKRRIEGRLNGGGASVRADSNSGNIHLTLK